MRFLMWASVAGVGLVASALWADLPGRKGPPGPPLPQMAAVPPNAAHITVEVSKTATQPRLVIPRPLLGRVKSGEARQQEIGGFVTPPVEQLLFALALAGSGFYLLRGRARIAFAAVLLLAVGATLGVNRATLANAPPPLDLSPPLSPSDVHRMMLQERFEGLLLENVQIEVTPEQGELRLIVPATALPRPR